MTTALLEAVNGHVKGRAVSPETLYPFTFQGTGRTVQIRKVSALLRDEATKQARRDPAYPEPQMPMSEVDYGAGKIMEPNPSHPLYLQLHQEWARGVTARTGEMLQRLAVRRGVVCEIDQDAVAAVKADLEAVGIDTTAYDDHYIFVAFVCVGPYADWQDLLKVIFDRSGPSEAAIAAHTESFRGNGERESTAPPEPGSTE